MMKKRLFLSSLLLIGILGLGSIAYTVIEDRASSVITASNVKIQANIVDEQGNEASNSLQVAPATRVTRMMSVTNIGDQPAWVRLQVRLVDIKDTYIVQEKGLLLDNENIELTNQDTKWIYQDGYFYYTEILQPTQTSDALFSSIEFLSSMDNSYANSSIYIELEAQGVQSKHQGNSVLEAKGWPE